MDFRKYIAEAQRAIDAPVTGDDFDFQINESLSIECQVVEHTDDTFIIGLDQRAWDILKEAELVNEAETCTECGMGTMYQVSEGMRCDECGYSMAMEAAPVHLMRARELDIHHDMGDGYWIGSDLHDDGDSRKVSYSLYKLEDPVGLTDQFANAWRDVGHINVSSYSPKKEDILAGAAKLKINDMAKKATPESLGEAGFMDKVKGALGMGQKAAPAATPAAAPVSKPATLPKSKLTPGSYDFRKIQIMNLVDPNSHHGSSNHTPGWNYFVDKAGGRNSGGATAIVKLNDGHFYLLTTGSSPNSPVRVSHTNKTEEMKVVMDHNYGVYKYYPLGEPAQKPLLSKKIGEDGIDEAEYQGRSVTLGKPSAGDVKKYKVYVRDPTTGNTKKVNFGDKKMSIKRDNPARRKNFRARHNCSDKKDRTSAGYWSCRMWSTKPVSKILKGK